MLRPFAGPWLRQRLRLSPLGAQANLLLFSVVFLQLSLRLLAVKAVSRFDATSPLLRPSYDALPSGIVKRCTGCSSCGQHIGFGASKRVTHDSLV
ncbi:hypothetical protein V8C35DRAFT_238088 [Trichoderma chlorosporum]